jgi:hypothetical protein
MALAHQGDFRSGRNQGAVSAFIISEPALQRCQPSEPNAGRMPA